VAINRLYGPTDLVGFNEGSNWKRPTCKLPDPSQRARLAYPMRDNVLSSDRVADWAFTSKPRYKMCISDKMH
jgi:hypothetical protein